MIGLCIVMLFVLSAIFSPFIAPYNPLEGDLDQALKGHSRQHWLGTDEQGRDILSRIIYGGRYSLAIGVVAVSIAICLGVLLGVLSGYVGGKVDAAIMRTMDILMSFPGMLLAMAIVSALGPSLVNLMISIGIYSVPTFSRVVRGSVLSIKEMEYVEAAKAVGLSHFYIVVTHVLPNCVGPFLVLATLQIATAILSGAGLSFLGSGAAATHARMGGHAVIGPSVSAGGALGRHLSRFCHHVRGAGVQRPRRRAAGCAGPAVENLM